MKISNIHIIGGKSQAGTYVLRIHLKENTTLQFGRFKKGKLISLPAGDYAYVGSALSEKGATSLARRLIRHATRSGNKPPHTIRLGSPNVVWDLVICYRNTVKLCTGISIFCWI